MTIQIHSLVFLIPNLGLMNPVYSSVVGLSTEGPTLVFRR